MRERKPFEDLFPLSPMQQGMLFHSLLEKGTGVYVCQTRCTLVGPLDREALRRSWEHAVAVHPALRTAFDWQRRKDPFQIVYHQVRLPWKELDWRELPAEEVEKRFETLLARDRAHGYDLARPPLMRFLLVREAHQRYRFLWSVHHLLVDGWCQGLILRDVFAAYRASQRGEALRVETSPPFRAYVGWLQNQDLGEAESKWRRVLEGFRSPTPSTLPTPPAGSAAAPGAYGEHSARLSSQRSEDLTTWLRSQELTLNTLMQGLWGLLLARRSGEEDVVFGATVSGRPADLPRVEEMVGLFINTLPVRLHVNPRRPLGEWLQEVQREQAEMRRFEFSPLVEVQGWSEVPRGETLFQTLLVVETFPMDASLLAGESDEEDEDALGVEALHSFDRVNYPLSLQVVPGEELTLRLKFDPQQVVAEDVEILLRQLEGLVHQARHHPERPLGDFTLATPGLPDPTLELPTPAQEPIARTFGNVVAMAADHVALVFDTEHVTYGALDDLVSRTAQGLEDAGQKPGEVVAVEGARRVPLIAGLLAVLRRGGVLLPLDPNLPEARRRAMCEAAAARRALRLQDGELVLEKSEGGEEATAHDPRAAYVFFTSGTTGKPKGVLGTHGGLAHFLGWQRTTFQVGLDDRAAQLTALSFDVVLRDIFLPLTSGATLLLPPTENPTSHRIPSWLARERVTLLHTVPSVARTWLEPDVLRPLPALRRAFFAGEPLGDPLVRRFRQALATRTEVVNLYGPTETTLARCFHRVPVPEDAGIQPVGRPLPESQALVLRWVNGEPHLCGVGEPGEIVLRTPFRTLGYLEEGEAQGRFLANPYRHDPEDLLYRSGDLGSWRRDGVLEIHGRLDHQVKIRGVRVEPAEVAAGLETHPAVHSAVVMGQADPDGQPTLVAWWVAEEGSPNPSDRALREHLGERLPQAAIPSIFRALDAMPLTPNGKVDRRRLPEPSWDRETSAATSKPPRGPVEELLAGLMGEVLRRRTVGRDEDFFTLGGHSLLATRLVARIRRVLGVEVSLAELFTTPTVVGLARLVAQRKEGGGEALEGAVLPAVRALPEGSSPVLSFAQERLWFLDQLDPGRAIYNVHQAARLRGALRIPALATALDRVSRRHKVLRTGFGHRQGKPEVLGTDAPLALPVVDLRALPPAFRQAEERRLGREQTGLPFDLGRPPLLRALLLALGSEEHGLLLTLHHIVCDAWSLGLLVDEVARLYGAASQGESHPLPPLPVQYQDFAHTQRTWLAGEVLDKCLEAEIEKTLDGEHKE